MYLKVLKKMKNKIIEYCYPLISVLLNMSNDLKHNHCDFNTSNFLYSFMNNQSMVLKRYLINASINK
jgi:hypothetical protein